MPQEAACTMTVTPVWGTLSRDDSASSAAEGTCEALLLKNKGGIEVTRETDFGTLTEGGSRSLVICIE